LSYCDPLYEYLLMDATLQSRNAASRGAAAKAGVSKAKPVNTKTNVFIGWSPVRVTFALNAPALAIYAIRGGGCLHGDPEAALAPISWIEMRHRRTAPGFAIYSAGQTNQENSCVAVIDGLRAVSRKIIAVKRIEATVSTKMFQSLQALFVGADP
jgi:hypothetical protein